MSKGEAAKIVLDFKGARFDIMNQAFEEKLQTDLDALKKAGTYKRLRHLTTPMAPEVHMEEAGDVIVLSSNNYLGLADLAEVVEAGKRGLEKYGAGTASVRFICGTFDIHRILEERIAEFLGTQAALSYVSCWNANTGLFPTICDAGSAIVSDELNHASIIDGVRLASKARRERYKHSDMGELEAKLKAVARLLPDRRRHRRRLLDGRRSRQTARDRRAREEIRRDHRRRRFARNRRDGQDGARHDRALRPDRKDRHHHGHARQSAGRRGGRVRRRQQRAGRHA